MPEPDEIIYPPPEVRGIVDRTAQYVAKNGSAFEEKVKQEHRDKPKFSFLLPNDPFYAYYQHKVREIRNSLLCDLDSKLSQESSKQADDNNVQEHAHETEPKQDSGQDLGQGQADTNAVHEGAPHVTRELNDYIHEMTTKLEEPAQLNYLASSAPSLMQRDNDIIKLTTQFIATYGRHFLLELVSREQNNTTFDFLKPQHGQFSYMTNLIMQYALIRNQPLDITEQLSKDAYSQKHVLDKIKIRAEWTKMLELERKKREEEEEKERILYGLIDWHDFVIVETIHYQPDEKGEYPPTTADQVGTRLLLQQRYEEQTEPEEMEIDMDVENV